MWWVCVEPACEMTPSQSQDKHLRCRLIELENCTKNIATAVKDANGKYLFVKHLGKREVLAIESGRAGKKVPVVKTAFIAKDSQITLSNEEYKLRAHFPNMKTTPPEFLEREMTVVAQLREAYANRLLQASGSHLSRIGLDIVNLPEVKE